MSEPVEAVQQMKMVADAVFARLSPYQGAGLRNHCLRLYKLTKLLQSHRGLVMDDGLLYAIAMLHDLGLVARDVEGEAYPERSFRLFLREFEGVIPLGEHISLIRDCLVYNHRVFPVLGLRPEAECLRAAVWIEHSRGLLRFGLPWSAVRQVFHQHPRENLDAVLLNFTYRVVTREPRTLVHGIFFG